MLPSFKWLLIALGILMAAATERSQASPIDEARIAGIISAVAIYADNGDFEPLERFFAPETVVDYTSLWGGKPERFTPQALMAAWAGLLPGFDATRHELSDIRVRMDGDKATATVGFRATHWIGERSWIVAGSYDYDLVRSQAGWRIVRMRLRLAEEVGDRGLVQEASARAPEARKRPSN